MICQEKNCTLPSRAKGYCWKHYQQQRRHGRLTPEIEHSAAHVCSTCNRPHYAKGYCRRHYQKHKAKVMAILKRKQQWAQRIRDDLHTMDRERWYSNRKYFDDDQLGNFEAVFNARTDQWRLLSETADTDAPIHGHLRDVERLLNEEV